MRPPSAARSRIAFIVMGPSLRARPSPLPREWSDTHPSGHPGLPTRGCFGPLAVRRAGDGRPPLDPLPDVINSLVATPGCGVRRVDHLGRAAGGRTRPRVVSYGP